MVEILFVCPSVCLSWNCSDTDLCKFQSSIITDVSANACTPLPLSLDSQYKTVYYYVYDDNTYLHDSSLASTSIIQQLIWTSCLWPDPSDPTCDTCDPTTPSTIRLILPQLCRLLMFCAVHNYVEESFSTDCHPTHVSYPQVTVFPYT